MESISYIYIIKNYIKLILIYLYSLVNLVNYNVFLSLNSTNSSYYFLIRIENSCDLDQLINK